VAYRKFSGRLTFGNENCTKINYASSKGKN